MLCSRVAPRQDGTTLLPEHTLPGGRGLPLLDLHSALPPGGHIHQSHSATVGSPTFLGYPMNLSNFIVGTGGTLSPCRAPASVAAKTAFDWAIISAIRSSAIFKGNCEIDRCQLTEGVQQAHQLRISNNVE